MIRSVLALFLLALLLGACRKAPAPEPVPVPDAQVNGEVISFPKDSPQLSSLRTVEAVPDRESFVRINGRTVWDETITSRMTAPMPGRVQQVLVRAGQRVAKGDVLAVLSSPDFGSAQAESRRAETDLTLARRSLDRTRELHAAGVIPLKELQAAEADFGRARAERDRTEARDRLLGDAGVIDQQLRLRAPIGGIVAELHLTVGQEVRPDNTDVPLFVITNPERLWILLDVPEALTGEVTKGEAVRITVPALAAEVFDASVDYVADSIDPQSRTIKARATVDNRARRLKAEMFVTGEVEIPASEATRVPATAVILLERDYFVFVEELPGQFHRRHVRAEESSLGYMRILRGVSTGDKVVADGALLLQRLISQKSATPPARGQARSIITP